MRGVYLAVPEKTALLPGGKNAVRLLQFSQPMVTSQFFMSPAHWATCG